MGEGSLISKTRKNLLLQTAYQIVNTCIPLITAPYLARVLGAAPLGVFSYTTSVVTYFTLFAMLGTINYGTRSIAAVKDNKEQTASTFLEIFIIQLMASLLALICYCIYLNWFCSNNKIIATIQIIAIASCFFDISWFFFGMEDFRVTVTRSLIIRILSVIAILILVKAPDDLWIYTLIMLSGTLLSQVVLWFYLDKYICLKKVRVSDLRKHIKPNLILFIPLLAMSVYHIMDKTMLGLLSSFLESGYYYNSDKVINIPVGILSGIGTVMLPRMTALLSSNKEKEGTRLYVLTLEGVTAFSVAISLGIAGIAREFTPFFFGPGYEDCIVLIIVSSPVLIIKGISLTTRNQYFIPYKLESIFIKSVFLGATVNLLVNILLIPKHGALGAVIGTLIAEFIACAYQLIKINDKLRLQEFFNRSVGYLLIGIVMIVIVRLVALLSCPIAIKLILEIIVGAIVYIAGCLIYWKKTKNDLYYLSVSCLPNSARKNQ